MHTNPLKTKPVVVYVKNTKVKGSSEFGTISIFTSLNMAKGLTSYLPEMQGGWEETKLGNKNFSWKRTRPNISNKSIIMEEKIHTHNIYYAGWDE